MKVSIALLLPAITIAIVGPFVVPEAVAQERISRGEAMPSVAIGITTGSDKDFVAAYPDQEGVAEEDREDPYHVGWARDVPATLQWRPVNFALRPGQMYRVRVVQLTDSGDHSLALRQNKPLLDRTTSQTSISLDTRKMKVGSELVWQVTVVSGRDVVASSSPKGIIISKDTSKNSIAWHDRRSIERHGWFKSRRDCPQPK